MNDEISPLETGETQAKGSETWAAEHARITQAVAKELQHVRNLGGLTRRELTTQLSGGLSVHAYEAYEKSERQPPISRLVDICRVLGEKPGALLDRALQADEYKGLTVDARQLAFTNKNLPPLLRQWAKNQLAASRKRIFPVELKQVVIRQMATALGLSYEEMFGHLKPFAL
ncbi:MAG TPA: helix-turn-helix transcriptional regulator [Candidatus Saccharimonadales bacterium]